MPQQDPEWLKRLLISLGLMKQDPPPVAELAPIQAQPPNRPDWINEISASPLLQDTVIPLLGNEVVLKHLGEAVDGGMSGFVYSGKERPSPDTVYLRGSPLRSDIPITDTRSHARQLVLHELGHILDENRYDSEADSLWRNVRGRYQEFMSDPYRASNLSSPRTEEHFAHVFQKGIDALSEVAGDYYKPFGPEKGEWEPGERQELLQLDFDENPGVQEIVDFLLNQEIYQEHPIQEDRQKK